MSEILELKRRIRRLEIEKLNNASINPEYSNGKLDAYNECYKLILRIVSRSTKVKINEPFEVEETGEKYKVEIENFIDDNGLWEKETVIVKID